jgi:hypothetical protein
MTRFPLSVQVLTKYAQFVEEIHNNRDEADKVRRKIRRICEAGLSDEAKLLFMSEIGHAHVSHMSMQVVRTKKEQKEYREYKKQVYSFSRANTLHLRWMIRFVQVTLCLIAVAQLLLMHFGMNNIHEELEWMKTLRTCINTFDEVHEGLRDMQKKAMSNDTAGLFDTAAMIINEVDTLAENSTSLFTAMTVSSELYSLWGTAWLDLDIYRGSNAARIWERSTLRDATIEYARHAYRTTLNLQQNPTVAATVEENLSWRVSFTFTQFGLQI